MPPLNAEQRRSRRTDSARPIGAAGAPMSANVPGEPCAKIIARTATPGTISATTLARSRAYRWGEDGIAGFCDRYQLLVFRAGLLERPRPHPERTTVRPDAAEANHGEDVKEYYFHLDAAPTHSYQRVPL